MAPKRTRTVWERPTSKDSSFTDCPACEMKVVSYLINDHLDGDCPALIKSNEQLLTAKATKKLFKSPEALLCNREPHYDLEDFHASVCNKLDAGVEEVVNISNRETNSLGRCISRSDAGPQRGSRFGERDPHDRHDNGSHASEQCCDIHNGPQKLLDPHDCLDLGANSSEQCLEIHNGSPKPSDPRDRHDNGINSSEQCLQSSEQCLQIHNGSQKPIDELNSNAQLESPGGGDLIREASTSSSKSAKGDGWRLITATLPPKAPKGHYVFDNFISEKEEQDILSFLDTDLKNPWKISPFSGLQSGKTFGYSFDLRGRRVRPASFEWPRILVPVMERMRATVPVLKDFWPNETNAIDYRKHEGHWLTPHVDDRQLSVIVVVNLSLCGDCRMTFMREGGPLESYKVLLRRRSIQVLTGESRYNFTHSIRNDDLLDPRRVSMTFRQSLTF